jgi:hypothetical protein
MPIIQSTRRNLIMKKKIRRIVKICRLFSRHAEVIGSHRDIAFSKFRLFSRHAELESRQRDVAERAFLCRGRAVRAPRARDGLRRGACKRSNRQIPLDAAIGVGDTHCDGSQELGGVHPPHGGASGPARCFSARTRSVRMKNFARFSHCMGIAGVVVDSICIRKSTFRPRTCTFDKRPCGPDGF